MRLHKLVVLFIIMLVAAIDVQGAADTAFDLNIDVKTFQLENGLQVWWSNDRRPPK